MKVWMWNILGCTQASDFISQFMIFLSV